MLQNASLRFSGPGRCFFISFDPMGLDRTERSDVGRIICA